MRFPALPPRYRHYLPWVETFAIWVAFLWCVRQSFIALGILYYVQGMDSAGFVDLVARAAQGFGLHSPSFASFYDALPFMFADSVKFCSGEFTHIFASVSFSRWHPYFVASILAMPVHFRLLSALDISKLAISLSEFGLLFLLLLWLRRQRVPLLPAVFFVMTLFAFIPWAQGAFGQFYFDRLFLLSMGGMILLADSYVQRRASAAWALVLLALVIMTISERTTMMLGGFLIAYPLIFKRWSAFRDRRSWLLFALAGLCVLWSAFFVRTLQNDPTANFYTLPSIFDNLSAFWRPADPRFTRNFKLLAVLAPYILIALFNPRMALIAIGSIVPNFLVDIGGAERLAFLTHYHSTYLPFLAVAAAFGVVACHRRWGHEAWFGPGAALVLCLVFFYNRHIDFKDDGSIFGWTKPQWDYQFAAVFPAWKLSPYPGLKEIGSHNVDLVGRLPPGVTVTTQEPFMPALIASGRAATYLPVGLNQNNYAVIAYPSPLEGTVAGGDQFTTRG